MKTIQKILAVVVFSFVALSSFASGETTKSDLLRDGIFSSINYPAEAHEQLIQGTVDLFFSINQDGRIVIKSMHSSDPVFERDILSDLSKIQLPTESLDSNEIFHVKINFTLV